MLDVELKINVVGFVVLFYDFEEVMYFVFYKDRRKRNLV